MTVYKLYYFNARARGEGIRWLFHLAGVEFEDVRVDQAWWKAKKKDMPLALLPVLEVDGQLLAESQTIGRFLASKFGYGGNSEWDKALADQYVDAVYDLLITARQIDRVGNAQSMAEAKETFIQENGPRILGHFEKRLEASSSGFLVGDTVTWADVFLAAYLDSFIDRFRPFFGQLLENCQKVTAHLDRIRAIPSIAAFIAKRPYTVV